MQEYVWHYVHSKSFSSVATGTLPDKLTCQLRLMREASIQSRKSGEKNISANSIRKVTEVRMKSNSNVIDGLALSKIMFLTWQKTLRKFQGWPGAFLSPHSPYLLFKLWWSKAIYIVRTSSWLSVHPLILVVFSNYGVKVLGEFHDTQKMLQNYISARIWSRWLTTNQ